MPEKGLNHLFAYFAIADHDTVFLCEKITTGKERVNAQVDYARQVLQRFAEVIGA
jgi:hypothetical protein